MRGYRSNAQPARQSITQKQVNTKKNLSPLLEIVLGWVLCKIKQDNVKGVGEKEKEIKHRHNVDNAEKNKTSSTRANKCAMFNLASLLESVESHHHGSKARNKSKLQMTRSRSERLRLIAGPCELPRLHLPGDTEGKPAVRWLGKGV